MQTAVISSDAGVSSTSVPQSYTRKQATKLSLRAEVESQGVSIGH